MATPQEATPRWHGANAGQTKESTDSFAQAEATCRCRAQATCATCIHWRGVFDVSRMRRAERLERLLEVAVERGAVLAGAHFFAPRRGRWRPFRMDDLDVVERLVNQLGTTR